MTERRKVVNEPSRYHTKITDWPEDERPREKLVRHGAHALSDAELLALLIRTGLGAITAVDIAKRLLKEYQTLAGMATCGVQDLTAAFGVGRAKAAAIVAAFEVGRRSASGRRSTKLRVRSPEDVVARFQPLLRDLQQEKFYVLLLDSANNLIRDIEITSGILNSSLVHPREVFKPAIKEPAAGIIAMHNHPSGNPEPSAEDITVTRQIVEAGKIIGIPVHDHIIITATSYTSFAERGLL